MRTRKSIRHSLWAAGAAIGAAVFFAMAPAAWASDSDPLPRRGTIGFAGSPDGHPAGGIVISQVRPGGPAEKAGLRPNDRLLTLNGAKTENSPALQEAVRGINAGGAAVLEIVRDGQPLTLTATLEPVPAEVIEGSVVTYSSVAVPAGYRLRTIITEPAQAKAQGTKSPAFFFVQGLMCQTLDRAHVPQASDTRLVHAMARAGYVTIRVDKPGTGDSEGPPCRDIDFATELAAYAAALAQLKSLPTVDPERVYIFGHSMGGVMAPYLARQIPVRGAIVYGTASRNWLEYTLENVRRQLRVAGVPPATIEEQVQRTARLYASVLLDRKTVAETWQRYPELRENAGPLDDEVRLFGRHVTFFQQLQDLNLPRAWEEAGTNVLAIHGQYDAVSDARDHELIAQIASASGKIGVMEQLLLADHGFTTHMTQQQAMQSLGQGLFAESLPKMILAWIDKVEGRS